MDIRIEKGTFLQWNGQKTLLSLVGLIVVKLFALLVFQYQSTQNIEKLVRQQFLLIESFASIERTPPGAQPSTHRGEKQRFSLADSPHPRLIELIEGDAGMTLRAVCEHIMHYEGKRPDPYPDNIGIAVGVGRNLTTFGITSRELRAINPKFNINDHIDEISIGDKGIFIDDIEIAKQILSTPLSDHHIALLLLSNLKKSADDVRHIFGQKTWDALSNARKEALVNLAFNLGLPNFSEFKKFIAAIKDGDFEKASQEILLSLAAEQNPIRYREISQVIKTDDPSYFEK